MTDIKELSQTAAPLKEEKYLTEEQVRAIVSESLTNLSGNIRLLSGQISNLSNTVSITPTGTTITELAAGSLPSILGWTSTLTFSSTDYNTTSWSTGTITLSDGTSYSISSGNTGNMSAITYIYLDISVSTTALQTSTTAADSVGANKILIGVAQNNSDTTSKSIFQVFGGKGGQLMTVDNIAANSASTNQFVSNTAQIKDAVITSAKIASLNADVINAGTITGRTLRTAAPSSSSGKAIVITGGTNQDIAIYNNTTVYGYIGALTGSGGGETEYLRIEAPQSGRNLRFRGSMIACDGNFIATSNETYDVGSGGTRWRNMYADKYYQSTNTNGNRQVFDLAYVEMGLLQPRMLKKYLKGNKDGLLPLNGEPPEWIKLPFKKGTVLIYTSKGLTESHKKFDKRIIAVANNTGLPIVLGAEPVRMIGKAKIGQYAVSSDVKGCAMAVDEADSKTIIGKVIQTKSYEKEGLTKVMIK